MAGGNYRKLKSGKWNGRVMVGGKSYSVTKPTKREVQQEIAALEVQHSADRAGSATPLAAVIVAWWPAHAHSLAEATRIDYRRVIDTYVIPELGDTPIGKLHQRDLHGLYARLSEQGLSSARIYRVHTVLRVVCAYAVEMDLIGSNPASKVSKVQKLYGAKAKVHEPPTVDEIRGLLAEADNARIGFATFLTLSAITGARRGELLALRATDLDGSVVTISRAISVAEGDHGVGHNLIEKAPKTAASIRRLTLDADTTAAVWSHLAVLEERAASAGLTLAPDHFLFSEEIDASMPWRPEGVSRVFAKCAKRAGIDVRLHDLRHAVATVLMANGVDVVSGASRLGHARRDTFLNRYAHAMPATDGHVADVMADVIYGND